jgi:Asp-tRNA(Asn)/Glu-tRNA(Gln) amidotransferase A subunit family amidase
VLQEAQMRELGSADFRQTLDGFLKMATILDRRGYIEAMAYRSRVLRDWLAFLESYPVILTPLSVKRTPEPNADLGGDARVHSLFWNDLRFMSSINVLGLPAAVVPIGLVAGNPVGVQLLGSHYLKAALAQLRYEEAFMPAVSPAQLAGWEQERILQDGSRVGCWGTLAGSLRLNLQIH